MPRFRIVVDAHNAVFAPPWSRLPGAIAAMNRCDLVLVHNAEARAMAEAAGVAPEKLRVLEDPPPLLAPPGAAPAEVAAPYVLVPCSFRPDEPIPVLLAAARRLPEVGFRVTGSRRRAAALGFVAAAPGNVVFTDYLPVAEFEPLLRGAAVVLGLTTVEGIQLSVANEALGADRALVLSDTRILRTLFGAAALFAPNTPEGLAAALQRSAGAARRARGPQRGAEDPPAGRLARRGQRADATGGIRLPGRNRGPGAAREHERDIPCRSPRSFSAAAPAPGSGRSAGRAIPSSSPASSGRRACSRRRRCGCRGRASRLRWW